MTIKKQWLQIKYRNITNNNNVSNANCTFLAFDAVGVLIFFLSYLRWNWNNFWIFERIIEPSPPTSSSLNSWCDQTFCSAHDVVCREHIIRLILIAKIIYWGKKQIICFSTSAIWLKPFEGIFWSTTLIILSAILIARKAHALVLSFGTSTNPGACFLLQRLRLNTTNIKNEMKWNVVSLPTTLRNCLQQRILIFLAWKNEY